MKSILTKRQVKTKRKKIRVDGKDGLIEVDLSYDDACNNGHNSFHITGNTYDSRTSKKDKHHIGGGCIHEEIAKHFPEYKHMIKWHGTTSEGPLYYIENTTYHARDRTHEGVDIGEAVAWDKKLYFEGSPFTFKEQRKGFWEFLDSFSTFENLEITTVPYDGSDAYNFSPNFSFNGFIKENETKKWYKAPFSTLTGAEEFQEALKTCKYAYKRTPAKYCEAVTPDLKAARSTAIWPEATLKQLQSKKALLERLPGLMECFRRDIEKLGFIF